MKQLLAAGLAVVVAAVAAPQAVGAPATGHHTAVGTKRGDGHSVLEAKSQYVYTHMTSTGHDVGCNSSCLRFWPRVTSSASPRAIDGVRQRRLRTTPGHQVTYYGHKLYYFSHDSATLPIGRGITSYGAKWRLITVTGRAG